MAHLVIRRCLSLEKLLARPPHHGAPLAAIVLGHTLPADALYVLQRCAAVIAADSGADRLMALEAAPLPQVVIGDLDSISARARDHYDAKGVKIVDLHDDQNSTDMQKALDYFLATATAEFAPKPEDAAPRESDGVTDDRPVVLVLGGLDGRLDHTFSNINTALMYASRVRIILVSDHSAAEVLPAGEIIIELDREKEGDTCGLVPLVGTLRAKTMGLVYCCDGLEMALGGLISSSNSVLPDFCRVNLELSAPALWSLTRCGTKGVARLDPGIHRAAGRVPY